MTFWTEDILFDHRVVGGVNAFIGAVVVWGKCVIVAERNEPSPIVGEDDCAHLRCNALVAWDSSL